MKLAIVLFGLALCGAAFVFLFVLIPHEKPEIGLPLLVLGLALIASATFFLSSEPV